MLPSAEKAKEFASGTTTPSDLSTLVLDNLFGMGWDNYFQGTIGPGPFALFFDLLKYLNALGLTVATILIVYVALVGVTGSAHEGVPLGKRYSTLWTPIRSVTAIASLIPIPGIGISTLQALILMAVGLSVSGANHLWNQAVGYMQNDSMTLVASELNLGGDTEAELLAKTLIRTATTQAYLTQMNNNGAFIDAFPQLTTTWEPDIFSADYLRGLVGSDQLPKNGGGAWFVSFDAPDKMRSLDGDLGGIHIPCIEQNIICDKKMTAVITMIHTIYREAAIKLVAGNKVDQNVLSSAKLRYQKAIAETTRLTIQHQNAGFKNAVTDFSNQAKQGGWILAGSWYWTITSIQERTRDLVSAHKISVTQMNNDAVSHVVYDDFRSIMKATDAYTGYSLDNAVAAAKLEKTIDDHNWLSGFFAKISRHIRDFFLSVAGTLTASLTEGDPIQNLKAVGDTIIGGAEIIIATTIGIEIAKDAKSLHPLNMMASGMKGIKNVFSSEKDGGNAFFTSLLLMAIITPIFVLGLSLAYYLPTLPFFLWMSGVITWLLLVVEALLAAPIIAIGVAIPEGEGTIGPHARRSMLLIANIVFRPPLMIATFFFVFYAIKGIVWIIGLGYIIFYNGLQATSFIGPLTVVMTVFLIGTFLIVVIDRIFSLINEAPSAIFNWIEGGTSHLGGDGGVYNQTRAIAATGNKGIGQSGGDAARTAASNHTAAKKQREGGRQGQQAGSARGGENNFHPADSK